MGLKPPITIYQTLITKDNNNEIIEATPTRAQNRNINQNTRRHIHT